MSFLMALQDLMLGTEKLFVVLAVVLIIWVGIVLFIYRTDRRISRLEAELRHMQSSQ